MDSQQSMFLILGAFYLYESVLWLPRGTVAFTAGWTGTFHLRHPGRLFGNHRGALIPKPWLPAGRRTFLCAQSPVSISPEGIVHSTVADVSPGEAADTSGETLKWDEIESIKSDKRWVRINGRRWWKTPSLHNAMDQAKRLREIRKTPVEKRAETIGQWLTASLDSKAAKKDLAAIRSQTRRLGLLGGILFTYMFVCLLPLSALYSFRGLWAWIIGLGLAQTIPITYLFYRAHRALYPAAGDERFVSWLTMLLFAPAAARAHDGITLPLLYRFHPLAIVIATLKDKPGRRYAAFVLRGLHFPSGVAGLESDDLRTRIESWHRTRLAELAATCCDRAGWKAADLLRPPKRSDPDSKSYCPRCLAEFVITHGACADCCGVSLREFELGTPEH